ncbi:hypothetical protein K9O30_07950 [Clostridium bowmanii]|uniref:hypothetical protein n=1 Tax=Clostridium bowmanii TaxID=132925 RepID=UPI001C0BEEB9|nr:hypothetical protein [Clostridium bowmanii]MBU3188933.1 hypothetical protein [Clostridium bowmanii]MCA1073658.1 hypothetical protein [Clostridium bowmanii]
MIKNKDIELEELKNKYKNMLSDKESSIIEQKEELQKVYEDLLVVQKDSKESSDELLSIRIDHSKQMELLAGTADIRVKMSHMMELISNMWLCIVL